MKVNPELKEAKSACIDTCPTYQLCKKMYDTGISHLLLANSANSMVEFEADDGRLVSEAEYFGIEDLTKEQQELHRSAGTSLRDAAVLLQNQLLEGCANGAPTVLPGDNVICESANRREVGLIEEDLRSML